MILRLSRTLLLGILTATIIGSPALAAKPTGGTASVLGNDVSYPQCSKALPSGQAFGIVGVNNGLANTTNPCLATEIAWAQSSTGLTAQPKAQLYVNTANPGGLNTLSWPSNNVDPSGNVAPNPYGVCDHSNSLACAWQYGWNRAVEDAQLRGVASPASYTWWLDVETANTWKTDGNTASNRADLEGMVAYFETLTTQIGIYSTSSQWGSIAGTVPAGSNLNGLDNWRPGARNSSGAKSNCSLAPLTAGGHVTLTQWVSANLDYDHSCI